jgi:Fic family protein
VPIEAGIAHYQYATIHPYYDGNGRTARLLTTLILHLGTYDLKGLYALEEYYARNLKAYYEALTVGPSHNYYMGRAKEGLKSPGAAEMFKEFLRAREKGAQDDRLVVDARKRFGRSPAE